MKTLQMFDAAKYSAKLMCLQKREYSTVAEKSYTSLSMSELLLAKLEMLGEQCCLRLEERTMA